MAITKKKRKKRMIPKATEVPLTQEEKDKIQFKDEFQKSVGEKIEDFGDRFQGKGKNILYGLAALGVLAIVIGIFFMWNQRSNDKAQAALGDAIETSQAIVTDSPVPATFTGKAFKTEKERADAAIKQFQVVADNYSGDYAEKAKYFIAVTRLKIDRAAGIKELEALTSANDEVGAMSKFALAQARTDDGKLDEAAKLYQELLKIDDSVVAKDTINFELAQIYQKQNKTKEAADLYFAIAKQASEAKDAEQNPVPLSQTAREAREKLEEIAPERAKQIKEPETPPMGLPSGF
ncbi:MAG: tetratricopeptide repeat protein [Acidobacteriota bacterium]|nr:tetratricopeptide repeat protein [Acidobacteriota bacterium]